jgi:hypothetical protein
MRLEIEGIESFEEGDEIAIGDTIRVGDIVWFDRVEPHKVVLRVVTEPAPASGICYRIDRGSAPDVVRLVVFQQPMA